MCASEVFDHDANIYKQADLAPFDNLRSGVLWDRGGVRGKLRQLPDLASRWCKRVSCLSPSLRPSDHRLHGHSLARRDRIDHPTPSVSTSFDPLTDDLVRSGVAVGGLDFHLHHSVADSGATERGRLVAAADRPFARDQFLVSPSAVHGKRISFSVDDVGIATRKGRAPSRSRTSRCGFDRATHSRLINGLPFPGVYRGVSYGGSSVAIGVVCAG
ncbi:MAG: hypothetical protein QOH88_2643 [Verrucomicrobiota bacterium]